MKLTVRDMIVRTLKRVIDSPHYDPTDSRERARREAHIRTLHYIERQDPECAHIVRAANAASVVEMGTGNIMRLSAFTRDHLLMKAAHVVAAAERED